MLVDQAKPARATLLLAHGAGAPMDSAFMNAMASGLQQAGITVVRFEFPYMAERRRSQKRAPPNRMPVLEACFRELVAKHARKSRLFIGGKSMGGRVATMIADSVSVSGVVALGYPFHPPRRADKLRIEHLTVLQTPCLIVQGTRDALGSRDEVTSYRLASSIALHWLEDGDHSFEPRRASGRSHAQQLAEAVSVAASFMLATR
ncbi:MAG: putative hydrolase of the alpha/beta-hydrolase fold [Myxococcaceae bacterium]|nr:putative hydrolase of the alpha/beta-hydrolase fold [Myxococcaceae bacterium]